MTIAMYVRILVLSHYSLANIVLDRAKRQRMDVCNIDVNDKSRQPPYRHVFFSKLASAAPR